MDRKKVLVTAIGTAASTTIVSELKKTGKYILIGADIYNRNEVATSKDVDEFYVFPPSVNEQEKYMDFVLDFCKEHEIDFYFATIDEEVANISRHISDFERIGVIPCIPNKSLIDICHYKNNFAEWIEKNVPDIYIKTFKSIADISNEDYPVFIKPVEGRASIGCAKADSQEILLELISPDEIGKTVIVQELVQGPIITVDIVRSAATGNMMQIQRRELIRNGNGCGIAVEIINDEELSRIVRSLAEKLNLNGVINAEFFETERGYKIIEVNPRFSAGTSYSCMAGSNLVTDAVSVATAGDIVVGDIAYGKHYARRYETYEL
jgi:carbamoyl-phosphate synthase large subunit